MQGAWLIHGARVLDPSERRDEIADVAIVDGLIALPSSLPRDANAVDAEGLVVTPGLIDLHVHLREPGNEGAETIASGLAAAAAGGFTRIVMMPNTVPPMDRPERIRWALERARICGRARMMATACISKERAGKCVADLPALHEAGAAAFTDDGATVPDESTMEQAMRIAAELDIPVMDHALDPILAGRGVMHRGHRSEKLGMEGIHSEAEIVVVRRDIELCRRTGCRVHIQHVSSAEAVDLLRQAHDEGLPVSGEVTPHHLALTDADVDPHNADHKMSPPLRTGRDRDALAAGAADGTLAAFATDHAPHCSLDKAKGFRHAPFGVIGLETAVGVTYSETVRRGLLSVMSWLERWTSGPAAVVGIEPPAIRPGGPADLAILDLSSQWTVSRDRFLSKSRNTPFDGKTLIGRAIMTFCGGVPTWDARGN